MLKILFALYVSNLKIPKNMLVAAQSFLVLNLKKNQGRTNKYMEVFSNKNSSQIYTYSCSNFVTSSWKEGQTRAPVYQPSTLVQCALRHLPSRVQPGGAAEKHYGLQPVVV